MQNYQTELLELASARVRVALQPLPGYALNHNITFKCSSGDNCRDIADELDRAVQSKVYQISGRAVRATSEQHPARRKACSRFYSLYKEMATMWKEGVILEACARGLALYALPSWQVLLRVRIDDGEVEWNIQEIERIGLDVEATAIIEFQEEEAAPDGACESSSGIGKSKGKIKRPREVAAGNRTDEEQKHPGADDVGMHDGAAADQEEQRHDTEAARRPPTTSSRATATRMPSPWAPCRHDMNHDGERGWASSPSPGTQEARDWSTSAWCWRSSARASARRAGQTQCCSSKSPWRPTRQARTHRGYEATKSSSTTAASGTQPSSCGTSTRRTSWILSSRTIGTP